MLFLCAVMLKAFPPATVQMKTPVSVPPWANSDQNVGNLLMVCLTNFSVNSPAYPHVHPCGGPKLSRVLASPVLKLARILACF